MIPNMGNVFTKCNPSRAIPNPCIDKEAKRTTFYGAICQKISRENDPSKEK